MADNRALRVRALLPRSCSRWVRKSVMNGAARSAMPSWVGGLPARSTARPSSSRQVGFAALGVLAGLGLVLILGWVLPVSVTGGRPHIAVDLANHLSVLVVLLAAFLGLARPGFSGPDRPESAVSQC